MPTPQDELEGRLAEGWSNDQQGDGVADRLRGRVMAAYDAAAHAPAETNAFPFLTLWRWMMARPVPRIGLPLTAAVLVMAFALSMTSPQRGFALEGVVDKLLEAKTVRCRVSARMQGRPGTSMVLMSQGTFSRQERQGDDHVKVSNSATGESIDISHASREARLITVVNRPPEQSHDQGALEWLRNQLRGVDLEDGATRKPLGKKVIDGKRLVGFRIEGPGGRLSIWGDLETALPHAVECQLAAFPDVTTVMTDFEFDVDFAPELFSLEPPEGYRVTRKTLDLSPPTEAEFLKALGAYAKASDGAYPPIIDLSQAQAARKRYANSRADDPEWRALDWKQRIQQETRLGDTLNRGFVFVLRQKRENNAAYAGAGVKKTDGKRPIFWSQPKAGGPYRVIRADLTVVEADKPPVVKNAQSYPRKL